jgi:hypothetical protein
VEVERLSAELDEITRELKMLNILQKEYTLDVLDFSK